MSREQLVSYFQRLVALETDAYVHTTYQERYQHDIMWSKPDAPVLLLEKEETSIEDPRYSFTGESTRTIALKKMAIGAAVLAPTCIGLKYLCENVWHFYVFMPFLLFVTAILSAICAVSFFVTRLIQKKKLVRDYTLRVQEYIQEEQRAKRAKEWNEEKRAKHEESMKEYRVIEQEYDQHYAPYFERLEKLTEQIENLRKHAYEQTHMLPQCQNLIAVCSFLDYFESGRAETVQQAQDLYISELSHGTLTDRFPREDRDLLNLQSKQKRAFDQLSLCNRKLSTLLLDVHNDALVSGYLEKTEQRFSVK